MGDECIYPELDQLEAAMLSQQYERVGSIANAFLDCSSGNKLVHFVVKTFANHYMTRNITLLEHVLKRLRSLSKPAKSANDRKSIVALLVMLAREKASFLDFSKIGQRVQDLANVNPSHNTEIDSITSDEEQRVYLNMWLHCINTGNSSAAVVVLHHMMDTLPAKTKMIMLWKVLDLAANRAGDLFPRYVQTCRALFELRGTKGSASQRKNLVYTCCYILAKRRQIVCIDVDLEGGLHAAEKLRPSSSERKQKATTDKLSFLFYYPTYSRTPIMPRAGHTDRHHEEIKEVKIRGAASVQTQNTVHVFKT